MMREEGDGFVISFSVVPSVMSYVFLLQGWIFTIITSFLVCIHHVFFLVY